MQWSEPDVPGAKIIKTKLENNITGLERLFNITAAQDPRLIPSWPVELNETFRRVGLEDVELEEGRTAVGQEAVMPQPYCATPNTSRRSDEA